MYAKCLSKVWHISRGISYNYDDVGMTGIDAGHQKS